jgi:hypothetical protein
MSVMTIVKFLFYAATQQLSGNDGVVPPRLDAQKPAPRPTQVGDRTTSKMQSGLCQKPCVAK